MNRVSQRQLLAIGRARGRGPRPGLAERCQPDHLCCRSLVLRGRGLPAAHLRGRRRRTGDDRDHRQLRAAPGRRAPPSPARCHARGDAPVRRAGSTPTRGSRKPRKAASIGKSWRKPPACSPAPCGMLTDGVAQQLNASDETARYIKEMTSSQREIAEHVEVLATSAEEIELLGDPDDGHQRAGGRATSSTWPPACAKPWPRSKRWPTRSKRSPRTSTRSRSTAEETSLEHERDGRVHRPGAVERQRDGAPVRGSGARRRARRRSRS